MTDAVLYSWILVDVRKSTSQILDWHLPESPNKPFDRFNSRHEPQLPSYQA